MQKDHRFTAPRTALQHKTLPFRTGNDFELLLLYGADNIADTEIVFSACNDAAKVRIE